MDYKRIVLAIVTGSLVVALFAKNSITSRALPNQARSDGSRLLPNGWAVSPAGRPIDLPGDMPLKMVFTPDGSKLIVATGGWHDQGISIIDISSEKLIDKAGLGCTWAGLAMDGDHIFVSGGPQAVRNLVYQDGLSRDRDFSGPAELGLSKQHGYYSAGVVARNGSVWVVNTDGNTVLQFSGIPLKLSRQTKVGYRPYALAFSPDGKTLAVSNWGDTSVTFLEPGSLRELGKVKVGAHPNEILYAQDGRLFVAQANTNEVSVIKSGQVVEKIRTSSNPRDLLGSTPDALALTPDGKTLFVANADNNDVAVVDVSRKESHVLGFIPTGWYPSALAVSPDGKKLFVGTAKGLAFRGNSPSQTPYQVGLNRQGGKFDYIGGVLSGHVNVVDIPDSKELAKYTKQVLANTPKPYAPKGAEAALKKIKHVFYIIRENRTYDQVFGDMPTGNGDPSLVLFGRQITPNAHQIASQFVLLDNLYCNGEVSEDGHQWCDAAYATDFTEKGWVNSYAGRGEPEGDSRLGDSPAGYLWDLCKKKGVTYRSYGEGGGFSGSRTESPKFSGAPALEGHASLAWSQQPSREVGGRDYKKMDVVIHDLHEAEKTGNWPSLVIIAIPEDHTSALIPGAWAPEAAVASNDLAVGKLLRELSHSKFWKDSAVFCIEDDAQDGADHVDAHRTVGLVASPYARRHSVDSTLYTTAGMIRTMEIILGLPPMNQFDAKATPMFASFMSKPDLTPYDLVPEEVALDTKNPMNGFLAERSKKLDLSGEDKADPIEFNRILWAYRQPGKPMVAPVRSIASR